MTSVGSATDVTKLTEQLEATRIDTAPVATPAASDAKVAAVVALSPALQAEVAPAALLPPTPEAVSAVAPASPASAKEGTDAAASAEEVEDAAEVGKLAEKLEATTLSNAQGRLDRVFEYLPMGGQMDIAYRWFLRVVSNVTSSCRGGRPLFAEATLLTGSQRRRIRDIELKKQFLEAALVPVTEDAEQKARDVVLLQDCLKLCELSGRLIDETIPQVVANILRSAPGMAEETALYSLWAFVPLIYRLAGRYISYQVQKRTGLHNAFVQTPQVQWLSRSYSSVTSRCSQAFVQRSLTGAWIDFEHVALTLMTKVQELQHGMLEDLKRQDRDVVVLPKNVGRILKTVASIMSCQNDVEAFITREKIAGENASFIARLTWHEEHGTLPPGLPSPKKVELTPENLAHELQEALLCHMATVVERFIDKYAPHEMLNNFLFKLEGRELFTKICAQMAVELGVEQLVNPHSASILILSAAGYKVEGLELDKFGPNSLKHVFNTAQGVIKDMLHERPDSEAILRRVAQSELRASPGGLDAERQKRDTKQLLAKYVYDQIQKYIGVDLSPSHDIAQEGSPVDGKLSAAGFANFALQVVIKTTVHAYKYYAGDLKPGETLANKVKGEFNSTNILAYLAKRIVGFVYHPSWRITVLHLLDSVVQSILTPDHKKGVISEGENRKNFSSVATFIFGNITGELFGKMAASLTGEVAYNAFRDALQPRGGSLLKKGVPVLLPLVKEFLLYGRCTQFARNLGVAFQADTKFWELFVRLYLNDIESATLGAGGVYASFAIQQAGVRALIRAHVVDKLHLLSPEELIKIFSLPPDAHGDLVKDLVLPQPPQLLSLVEVDKSPAPLAPMPPVNGVRKSPIPPEDPPRETIVLAPSSPVPVTQVTNPGIRVKADPFAIADPFVKREPAAPGVTVVGKPDVTIRTKRGQSYVKGSGKNLPAQQAPGGVATGEAAQVVASGSKEKPKVVELNLEFVDDYAPLAKKDEGPKGQKDEGPKG